MASREDLLQSIQPGMKLTRAFFLKVYGYEITWPGFKEQAITALEAIGCSKGQGILQFLCQRVPGGAAGAV